MQKRENKLNKIFMSIINQRKRNIYVDKGEKRSFSWNLEIVM